MLILNVNFYICCKDACLQVAAAFPSSCLAVCNDTLKSIVMNVVETWNANHWLSSDSCKILSIVHIVLTRIQESYQEEAWKDHEGCLQDFSYELLRLLSLEKWHQGDASLDWESELKNSRESEREFKGQSGSEHALQRRISNFVLSCVARFTVSSSKADTNPNRCVLHVL